MKTPFKTTSIVVGLIMSLLAISLFAKGLLATMASYGVPQEILDSPHYVDAITWVYIHMAVIGALIAILGYSVSEVNKQKWISLFITLTLMLYTYLDFIHSDSSFGNALYKGSQSVVPAYISLVMAITYFLLTINLFRKK